MSKLDIMFFLNRVGRTARAGKSGRSVAFVTQYDVEAYQRLEALIMQKLPQVKSVQFRSLPHYAANNRIHVSSLSNSLISNYIDILI